jgi:hypothetical protein
MDQIRSFVERLFKDQPPQEEVKQYIIESLLEKVEDLKDSGLLEQVAIDQTILEFGDAEDYYLPNLVKEKKRYQRQKTVSHYANDLVFAMVGSLIIIAISVVINIIYIDMYGPWSAIVSLGVLFWPLSLFYRWLNKRK